MTSSLNLVHQTNSLYLTTSRAGWCTSCLHSWESVATWVCSAQTTCDSVSRFTFVVPERRQFSTKAQAPNGTGHVQDAVQITLDSSFVMRLLAMPRHALRGRQLPHDELHLRDARSHICLLMRLTVLLRDTLEALVPRPLRDPRPYCANPSRDRPPNHQPVANSAFG